MSASTVALLRSHHAWASGQPHGPAAARSTGGYRPLIPVADDKGRYVLALPEGFDYVTFGLTGASMAGGGVQPRSHDGMGAFAGPDGQVRLVRNHELRNKPGDFELGVVGDPVTRYDARAMGGTLTIDYDPVRRRVVRERVSLNGTMVNCSGGSPTAMQVG